MSDVAPDADIVRGMEILGPALAAINFGHPGLVICRHADAITLVTEKKAFGCLALKLPANGPAGAASLGVYMSLDAHQLRRLAAQFLSAANHLDDRAGVQ